MRTFEPCDPRLGTPAGPCIVYGCNVCGAEVRSIPSHRERWSCTCGNVRVDPDAGRLSVRDQARLEVHRIVDVRKAFSSDVVTLESPLGPLLLGVVDPHAEGAAASVSWLLNRSIADARASLGGHLPEWLVEDIRKNYISIAKVETLWANHGYRFAVARADDGEMIGTVHVARAHDTILTVNRDVINVSSKDFPGFKPDGAHHVVNLSVRHEVRRAHVGRLMIDGIIHHFRDLFDGDALWVRADPPWHAGLVGLGFAHDPSMDIFLPPEVERTAGLPHAAFNARYACDCVCPSPQKPEMLAKRAIAMQTEKLQYVSFTRPFAEAPATQAKVFPLPSPLFKDLPAPDPRYARDWGGTLDRPPRGVVSPGSAEEVADLLRRASEHHIHVAVRGLGRSAAGQALSEGGLVLSTENLVGIDVSDIENHRLRVQGGVAWSDILRAVLPLGLVPPVVTGFLSTTVGGTLASGGYSKGSIRHGFQTDHVLELEVVTGDGRRVTCSRTQARWLFESALGGLGRFGVIVSATLSLVPAPKGILRSEISAEKDDVGHLIDSLVAFAEEPDAHHATLFERQDPGGPRRYHAVCARATDGEGDVPFSEYIAPPRELSPRAPSTWVHVFAPRSAAAKILSYARARIDRDAGDVLQGLPIRKMAPSRSLVRAADVPPGEVFFAILVTRDASKRALCDVEDENRDLLSFARSLGAKNSLGGLIPRTEAEWRAHLGDDWDEVKRRARMADPKGIFWP